MRTTFYNKYGAAVGPEADHVREEVFNLVKRLVEYVSSGDRNIPLRELKLMIMESASVDLSEFILKQAMAMRRSERDQDAEA